MLALRDAEFRSSRKFAVRVTTEFHTGVTVVAGPNGSGKTTMLRALATLSGHRSGTIELDGLPYAKNHVERLRRNIGYVPQAFAIQGRERVIDFLRFSAWLQYIPKATRDSACREALQRVGLSDRVDSRFGSLSGGMQRRVGIAQAILGRPRLLLMDEPTAGLDPETRVDLCSVIEEFSDEALVVMTSHLGEADEFDSWRSFSMPSPVGGGS